MRNYYNSLNIHRRSDELEKLEGLGEIKNSVDPDYFADVSTVLTQDELHMHYRRLHLQYDAIAVVLARGIPQQDSNSWSKRVVEFSPEPNELPE